jgi:hypothetical protein
MKNKGNFDAAFLILGRSGLRICRDFNPSGGCRAGELALIIPIFSFCFECTPGEKCKL